MPTVLLMARYEIDLRSTEASYKQLARLLRAEIEAGVIGPDQPLPSLRTISQDTGLDPKTIRQGIGLLVAEGLVVTVPGRGTYVRARS